MQPTIQQATARALVIDAIKRLTAHPIAHPEDLVIEGAIFDARTVSPLPRSEALCIVQHEGTNAGPLFNLDAGDYAAIDSMTHALAAHGLYAEEVTSAYAAIYPTGIEAPERNHEADTQRAHLRGIHHAIDALRGCFVEDDDPRIAAIEHLESEAETCTVRLAMALAGEALSEGVWALYSVVGHAWGADEAETWPRADGSMVLLVKGAGLVRTLQTRSGALTREGQSLAVELSYCAPRLALVQAGPDLLCIGPEDVPDVPAIVRALQGMDGAQ